jgi:hypothetical protein
MARKIVQYWVTYEYGFTIFARGPYDTRAETDCRYADISVYKMLENPQIIKVTKRKKR